MSFRCQMRSSSKLKKYTIKEISNHLGIPRSTVRFWEQKFSDVIEPTRTEGGQRRYSEKDLAILNQIKRLKQDGLSLKQIEEVLTGEDIQNQEILTDELDMLAKAIASAVRREIIQFMTKRK